MRNFPGGFARYRTSPDALSAVVCVSAWNKDPVGGVTACKRDPTDALGPHSPLVEAGGCVWDAGMEDPKIPRAYSFEKKPIKAICREQKRSRKAV